MAKSREPDGPLPLVPAPRGSRRRVADLQAQLKAAVQQGRLPPGARLPSTRELAARLGLGRNSVIAAYDRLCGDGYLEVRPGAGYRVAAWAPSTRDPAPTLDAPEWPERLNPRYRALSPVPAPARPPSFPLGLPDTRQLPFEAWRRLSARSLRRLQSEGPGYGAPAGLPRLREAIAAHVAATRAVACTPEAVLVTAGAQQAFDLLARVLVTPGQSLVAVEQPGYPPTRAAFAAAGARLVGVPVDAEGLVVEALPDAARVVCVTPAHQFPLGAVLSPRRRAALLAWARPRGAVLIEDDYDGEFRFAGPALDALQTLDGDAVCFVGSFSKCLFPALRLGYVVAPPWARAALAEAKATADWGCPLAAQDALASFIAEGHLQRHVRRMRVLYAGRHARLRAAFAGPLSPWLEGLPGDAGLHLAARLRAGLDEAAVIRAAARQGLGLSGLADYAAGAALPGTLLFGYGALAEPELDAALARLEAALRSVRRA